METNRAIQDQDDDVIDIEEHARQGKVVLVGKRYRFRVDKETYVVDKHELTGHDIFKIVGKNPQTHILYQHFGGGVTKVVAPGDKVDLTEKGVERFTTLKRANTEG